MPQGNQITNIFQELLTPTAVDTLPELANPSTFIDYLIVNGALYVADIVSPGNTGAYWTRTAPTQITWNPDADPLIFQLTPTDSVIAVYR